MLPRAVALLTASALVPVEGAVEIPAVRHAPLVAGALKEEDAVEDREHRWTSAVVHAEPAG